MVNGQLPDPITGQIDKMQKGLGGVTLRLLFGEEPSGFCAISMRKRLDRKATLSHNTVQKPRVADARCCGMVNGAIAQLGEHLLCKQGVVGSIPTGSTN